MNLERGGGVLLAFRNTYTSEPLVLPPNYESIYFDYEFTFAKILLDNVIIIIGAVYFPPDTSDLRYHEFFNICRYIFSTMGEKDLIFIFGDFNRPTLSFITDEEDGKILPLNFSDTSDLPDGTDITKTVDFQLVTTFYGSDTQQINICPNSRNKWLDLIFSNAYDNSIVKPASDVDNIFSNSIHHTALTLTCSLSNVEFSKSYNNEIVYNFRKTNFEAINVHLMNVDWLNIFQGGDINSYVSNFYNIIYPLIELHTPKMIKKEKATEPWLDRSLRALRNKRNKLYKLIKSCQVPEESILVQYHTLAHDFREKSNDAYNNYIANIGNEIISNPKKFFEFINIKKKCLGYPKSMTSNGVVYSNSIDICKQFAMNFQNIYRSDKTSFSSDVSISDDSALSNSNNINSLTNLNISTDEVISFVNGLDINSGPGPDLIPPIFLTNCVFSLAYPLTFLFNFSLNFGVFPDLWKSSFLVPVYKNGVKTAIENYRGIAKLSSIPKLFEKIIVHKIGPVLDPLLNEEQHGFRTGRSTTTNLAVFTSFVLCSMEKGLAVDTVYTDFSKAFDRVNHTILIRKLMNFGITGFLLKWFSSYLSNRIQFVKFEGIISEIIRVLSGVPQGSHLGPLLFLIFILDLSLALINIKHLFFADDLKIFHPIKNKTDVEYLQQHLQILETWCSDNLLDLNVDKCKVITFSKKKRDVLHFTYSINHKELCRVDFINDLGILLDIKLLFVKHFDFMLARASKLLGFCKRRASEFNNIWVTKSLYCSLVRSILEYGSLIWNPISNNHSKCIESVQKQFLLFALRHQFNPRDYDNLPSYDYRLRLIDMNSLSLRRKINSISFTYDVLMKKIDVEFISDKIVINEPERITRNPRFLVEAFHRTDYGQLEPLNRCCITFNLYSHLYHPGCSKNSIIKAIKQQEN